jgi:hydroxymethylpyrimidine/phosphomethylpyrimidine kinase
MPRFVALTITGSDSAGSGGLQADLRAFWALGVHGASALTAVGARHGAHLMAAHDVPASIVAAQIEAGLEDPALAAVKVGRMTSVPTIRAVARALRSFQGPIVIDPVLAARAGAVHLPATSVHALVRSLLPLATLATPNRAEAAELAGAPLQDERDLKAAARRIQSLGPRAVLIMGALRDEREVVDLLLDGRTYLRIASPRSPDPVPCPGDTLSAAITALLARGETVPDAVEKARAYLRGLTGDRPGSP